MASVAFPSTGLSRPSLAAIDATVSALLGPTRIPGNQQPACFNRQIAMYLAKHVGGWGTTQIGRFYNGRDHSTVCYGIQRIESLRECDSEIDSLLTDLKYQILENKPGLQEPDHQDEGTLMSSYSIRLDELAELIAERVCTRLENRYKDEREQD